MRVEGFSSIQARELANVYGIGKMAPADMITTKVPLERVVEDGFLELIRNKEKHVKVLVQI